jgi:hypothetical protein
MGIMLCCLSVQATDNPGILITNIHATIMPLNIDNFRHVVQFTLFNNSTFDIAKINVSIKWLDKKGYTLREVLLYDLLLSKGATKEYFDYDIVDTDTSNKIVGTTIEIVSVAPAN